MSLSVDLFWSFRSPYCYLVAPRLLALSRDFDVHVQLRPVYPLAVRVEGFFKSINPMAVPYFFRDIARVADMQGMPLTWPDPDPIVMDFSSGDVAADQPYISRLTRLGVAAEEAGAGLDFAAAVSAVIFSGTPNWQEGDHLRAAIGAIGLDIDALDETVLADADRLDRVILENEAAHRAAGHWGVPLMLFEDEPFFGQDRFDMLIWRMKQRGLDRRAA